MSSGNVIVLTVGTSRERFTCTRSTLFTIPYFYTYLQSVFIESTEEMVHIDRDAGLFSVLYEFARSPVLLPSVPDPEQLPRLLVEAEYYSLTTFMRLLKFAALRMFTLT